jgi:hypothetical protein
MKPVPPITSTSFVRVYGISYLATRDRGAVGADRTLAYFDSLQTSTAARDRIANE